MLVAQVFKKKYYPRGNFEFSFGTYIVHSMHGEAYGEQIKGYPKGKACVLAHGGRV
jgi:hypothetical protein